MRLDKLLRRWRWELDQKLRELSKAAWWEEKKLHLISSPHKRQKLAYLVPREVAVDSALIKAIAEPWRLRSSQGYLRAELDREKSSLTSQMDSKEFLPTTRRIAKSSSLSSVTVGTAEETDPRTILERVSGTQQFKANNSRGSSAHTLSRSEWTSENTQMQLLLS